MDMIQMTPQEYAEFRTEQFYILREQEKKQKETKEEKKRSLSPYLPKLILDSISTE